MKTFDRSEEKTEEFKIGRELWLVAKAAVPVIVAEFCRLFMNVIDSAFIVRFYAQQTLFSTEIKNHAFFHIVNHPMHQKVQLKKASHSLHKELYFVTRSYRDNLVHVNWQLHHLEIRGVGVVWQFLLVGLKWRSVPRSFCFFHSEISSLVGLIFALDTFVSQGFGARKPQNTN
jgi:hypothetical protein